MRETAFQALLRSTVFNTLSPRGLRLLKKEMRVLRLKRGQVLYREETPAKAFYFIVTGQIHTALLSSPSRNKKVHLYPAHHFLGETSLFTGLPHHFSAIADQDSELVEIQYGTFNKLTLMEPALHFNFSRHLGAKLALLEKKLVDCRKQCKLIAIRPLGHPVSRASLKRSSWFAMELALSLKSQFKKEVLLVDLNVQTKTIDELLNLKIPNHFLVIHLPARNSQLEQVVLRYADFVFHKPGESFHFETSAKRVELGLAKNPEKLEWQIGHYARVVAGKTVGVALSSGTALAVAHFGVLQELVRNKVPIDYIAGSSGGAIFGALFALGFTQEQFGFFLKRINRLFFLTRILTSLSFSKMGLLRFDRTIQKVFPPLRDKSFEDLKYPMIITGTNLTEGKPIYFKKGSLLDAMQISSSVPFLFQPRMKNSQIFADGCLVEPIPVRALRQMGADIVIAVDVTQKKVDRAKIKNLMDIYLQSNNLTNYMMGQSALRNADVVISVPQNGEKYFEYSRHENYLKYARLAVKYKMDELKSIFE